MKTGLVGEDLDCALQACAWSYWGRALNPASEAPIWTLYYTARGAHQTMLNFFAERNSTAAKTYPA
jgi:hypothetical protein